MQETWVQSLGWEDPLEKGKATPSSILAWRIPWSIQSMGSQRVGHDWVTFTFFSFQDWWPLSFFLSLPWLPWLHKDLGNTRQRELSLWGWKEGMLGCPSVRDCFPEMLICRHLYVYVHTHTHTHAWVLTQCERKHTLPSGSLSPLVTRGMKCPVPDTSAPSQATCLIHMAYVTEH